MGSLFDTRPLQLAPTKPHTQDREPSPSSSADPPSQSFLDTRPLQLAPTKPHTQDRAPSPEQIRMYARAFYAPPSEGKTVAPQLETLQHHPSVRIYQGQRPVNDVAMSLSDQSTAPNPSQESYMHHSTSSDPQHALVPSNTPATVTVRSREEEGMKILSPLHTMIRQINQQFSRERILRTTVGGFVTPTTIDYASIATTFSQYETVFRPKDLAMWQTITQQIHQFGGFFIGRDQQRWFDELEAEYTRLRTSLIIRDRTRE